jgi:hypothetical protein
MRGKGTFFDPRLADEEKFPVATKTKDWNIRNNPDLVTAKLPALHFYQLSIVAPKPPEGSFDKPAAARGQVIFNGKADCQRCHVPPLFTDRAGQCIRPVRSGSTISKPIGRLIVIIGQRRCAVCGLTQRAAFTTMADSPRLRT